MIDKAVKMDQEDELINKKEIVEILNEIKSQFERVIANVDEISDYFYKNSDSKSKSKQIIMHPQFVALSSSAKNLPMSKLISTSQKIKSECIKKNNFNFFSCELTDNDVLVDAIDRCKFEKTLKLVILSLFYTIGSEVLVSSDFDYLYQFSNLWGNEVFRNKNLESIRSFITWFSRDECRRRLRASIKLNNKYTAIREAVFSYETISGAKNLNKRSYFSRFNNDAKNTIGSEIAKIAMRYGSKAKEKKSYSTLINETFDHWDNISSYMKKNSVISQTKTINPVSGFTAIKNIRVKSSRSEDSDENFEKMLAKFKKANEFFESVSKEIEIIKIKRSKEMEEEVKLISGNEIVSLYDISSYKDNNFNSEWDANTSITSRISGGTLFGSCMRHPNYKHRISFYAKNPHFIKMLCLTSAGGKRISARAIVWHDRESGNHYVDRIFFMNESDRNKLISFIESEDGFYSIYPNGCPTKQVKDYKILFDGCSITRDIPYFDTMRSKVYRIGDKLYIGDSKDFLNEKVEFSTFHNVPIITKSEKIRNRCCSICGSSERELVKINERYYCKRNVKVSKDGLVVYFDAYNDFNKVISADKDENELDRKTYTFGYFNGVNQNFSLMLDAKSLSSAKLHEIAVSTCCVSGYTNGYDQCISEITLAGLKSGNPFILNTDRISFKRNPVYNPLKFDKREFMGMNILMPTKVENEEDMNSLRESLLYFAASKLAVDKNIVIKSNEKTEDIIFSDESLFKVLPHGESSLDVKMTKELRIKLVKRFVYESICEFLRVSGYFNESKDIRNVQKRTKYSLYGHLTANRFENEMYQEELNETKSSVIVRTDRMKGDVFLNEDNEISITGSKRFMVTGSAYSFFLNSFEITDKDGESAYSKVDKFLKETYGQEITL